MFQSFKVSRNILSIIMTNLISKFLNPKKEEQKEISILLDERISSYQKLESSLNELFTVTNFCQDNCFSQEKTIIDFPKGMYSRQFADGKEGCCYDSLKQGFYQFSSGTIKDPDKNELVFEKLQAENLESACEQSGSCEYHTDSGCKIEKFKSPTCASWICPPFSDELRDKYNIGYSNYEVKNSLTGLVFNWGDNKESVGHTISKINDAVIRIKNHNTRKNGFDYSKNINIK